jgi:broad specificity phosphatase PhoE
MTDFVLVRHGETEWSGQGRYAGATDVALNDAGRDQARRLAAWVAGSELAAAWSSPLARARETAEIAIGGAGIALHVDQRLAEINFGEGEGLTSAQMRERFPEDRAAFERDPVAHPLPGGEHPRAALERARSCLQEIGRSNRDARVLIVIHTTLIRLLVCHLMGLALGDYRRRLPMIEHTAVTELRVNGGEAALLRLNARVAAAGDR